MSEKKKIFVGVNKIMLGGFVMVKPQIKVAQNGEQFVYLTIGTSSTWEDKTSGEKKSKVTKMRVTCFNKRLIDEIMNWDVNDIVSGYCNYYGRVGTSPNFEQPFPVTELTLGAGDVLTKIDANPDMGAGLQKTLFLGTIIAAPQMKVGQNGEQYVYFTVGIGSEWADKTSGEQKSKTTKMKVMCFNKRLAEQIMKWEVDEMVYGFGSCRARVVTTPNAEQPFVVFEVSIGSGDALTKIGYGSGSFEFGGMSDEMNTMKIPSDISEDSPF